MLIDCVSCNLDLPEGDPTRRPSPPTSPLYATKAAADICIEGRLRDPSQLDGVELRSHIRRMAEIAGQLGETESGLRRWAHALDFCGADPQKIPPLRDPVGGEKSLSL